MKKNIILLFASSMLLASCGNGGNEDYLAEPSGGKVVEATVLAEPAGKLARGLAEKKAFGIDFKASGSEKASIKLNESDVAKNLGLSGKTYGGEASETLEGHVGIKDGKADASLTAGLKADVTVPSVQISGEDEETMSVGFVDKKINIDTSASVKAYVEEGVGYVDLSGVKDAAHKVIDVVKEISPEAAPEDSQIDALFGKFKVTLPETLASLIGELPTQLSTLMGMAASFLTNWESFTKTAPEEYQPILKAIEFKSYDGGVYGLHAAVTLKDLLKMVPSEIPESALTFINKIDAKAEALLLFSETEIVSLGAKISANLPETSFSEFLPAEALENNPLDKISFSGDFGFKLSFSYDDKVTVASVGDKSAYKEMGGAGQLDYGEAE